MLGCLLCAWGHSLKRALVCLALILTSLGASAQAGTRHRDMADREKHCRYGSVDHAKWSHHEVHLTLACAVKHWGVPGGYSFAHFITERESGDAWYARNPSSGACGIMQFLYWSPRVQAFNRSHPNWNAAPSCYNARANILTGIALAHSGGWSPWGF